MHHWIIESPNGRKSQGACLKCHAVKYFANTLDDVLQADLDDIFYTRRPDIVSDEHKSDEKLDKLPQKYDLLDNLSMIDRLSDMGLEILRCISIGMSPIEIREVLNLDEKKYINERNIISEISKGNVYDLIKNGIRSDLVTAIPLESDFVESNHDFLELLTNPYKIDEISRILNIDHLEISSKVKTTLLHTGVINRFELTARYEEWKKQSELKSNF